MISAILRLGESLGYVVKEEFPLEKKPGNPSAVDAAWLSDEYHDFPLMIFEVESKVTGAIANNPVKVFGQPNENFEKPLFFFHIFMEANKESSKICNLQNLFGLYNYRTYSELPSAFSPGAPRRSIKWLQRAAVPASQLACTSAADPQRRYAGGKDQ